MPDLRETLEQLIDFHGASRVLDEIALILKRNNTGNPYVLDRDWMEKRDLVVRKLENAARKML